MWKDILNQVDRHMPINTKKTMRKHGLPVELQNSRNWKLYNMGGVIWVKCIVLGRACSGSAQHWERKFIPAI